MGVRGSRDPDAEKRRIEKAQAGGFGAPGKAGRPKKDSTEIIEAKAADRMEYLVDKALDALERGLKSANEKTALDASAKLFKAFHHPTQKIDVTGEVSSAEYHLHILRGQDSLSESDQTLLSEFLDVLRDESEAETIDVDIIHEETVESKELPEETS